MNEPVTCAGKPVTLSGRPHLHPPIAWTLTITVLDSSLLITRGFGDTEIAKSPPMLTTFSVTMTQCAPESLVNESVAHANAGCVSTRIVKMKVEARSLDHARTAETALTISRAT